MSTLIATIGLVWLSLTCIAPKITKGNVTVSEFSLSLVPPALVASLSILMLICALGIATIFAMSIVGIPMSLEHAVASPGQYAINELATNMVATTAALVMSSKLMPSLISVTSGRWAAIASLPIALFMTAIGLMAAVPVMV
jgi:hypothetical protein